MADSSDVIGYGWPCRYRKRPVVIEGFLVTKENLADAAAWCGGRLAQVAPTGTVYDPGVIAIETLEGTMWAAEGDYIIRGVKGEFYPCKPDIFEATYDAVEDGYLSPNERLKRDGTL